MSVLKAFRNVSPHLELVTSVPVEGSGQFVLHRDHVFMSAPYGSSHTLSIIDVSVPEKARLVKEMKFKHAITSVAIRDDMLYAAEDERAINFINVENPAVPDYYDCCVALGKDLCDLKLLGKYAVVGLSRGGIGIIDVSDPPNARFLHSVKLDEGSIQRLVVAEGRIFAAGGTGGLRVFEIQSDELVEVASYKENAFRAGKVLKVGDRIWVVGKGDKEPDRVLVFNPKKPGEIESSFEPGEHLPSNALLPHSSGGAVGFYTHYTCMAYSAEEGWGGEIFKQFLRDDNEGYHEVPVREEEFTEEELERFDVPRTCMDEVNWMVRKGDHLIAAQGSAIVVYRILPGSIFEGITEVG
ncbi:MAG: hypothetical protein P8045_14260 [Candidatus Thiodiazotropha sp.]